MKWIKFFQKIIIFGTAIVSDQVLEGKTRVDVDFHV
jgi:hypothetical protein